MEWLEEPGRAGAGTGIREHRGAADQAFWVAKRLEARVLGSGEGRLDEGLPVGEDLGIWARGCRGRRGVVQGGSLEWGSLSRCSNFLPKAVESPGGLAKPWGDVVTFRNLLRSWLKTLSPTCGCLYGLLGLWGQPRVSVSLSTSFPQGASPQRKVLRPKLGHLPSVSSGTAWLWEFHPAEHAHSGSWVKRSANTYTRVVPESGETQVGLGWVPLGITCTQ